VNSGFFPILRDIGSLIFKVIPEYVVERKALNEIAAILYSIYNKGKAGGLLVGRPPRMAWTKGAWGA